jgi:hypothetical protein
LHTLEIELRMFAAFSSCQGVLQRGGHGGLVDVETARHQ